MRELMLQFAPDHPAAAGHFPGNPIIPGAYVLDEALRAIASALGRSVVPCEIGAVKFFHPVRPGDRVAVQFERKGEAAIRFACTVGGTEVMSGELTCRTMQ